MKKILILIVILLLLILTGITVINGLNIGIINIAGIKTLNEKNDKLEGVIQEATKLASTDYPKSISELNETLKMLQNTKKEYEEELSVSTDSDLQKALQIEYYPIEYLWVKVGQHAKENVVTIKMQPSTVEVGNQTLYNLDFTVTGSYIRIANFIRDIEDDESLGFKIENFNLLPKDTKTNTLEANFVCKNLRLSGISSSNLEKNK